MSFIFLAPICSVLCQSKSTFKVHTIAFYNVENLFDTINDPITFDDDRTPEGKDKWTGDIYRDKINHLAAVIGVIGKEVTQSSPALLGLAEVENRQVVEDLIKDPALNKNTYGVVHEDSPDRRGIDVALIYNKSVFTYISHQAHELMLYDSEDPSKRVYTRDQLVVSGLLDGELLYFIINHWPSRSGGEARSSYKREAAAALNLRIIDSLQVVSPDAKIVSMGDFNDDPINTSIKQVLKTREKKKDVKTMGLYNPMEAMYKAGIGTLAYRDTWNLFDQIIISEPFLRKDYSTYQFYKAGIFNSDFLVTPSGRYKGYPFRSFANGTYTGGYSDHFPVYIYLIKEVSKS